MFQLSLILLVFSIAWPSIGSLWAAPMALELEGPLSSLNTKLATHSAQNAYFEFRFDLTKGNIPSTWTISDGVIDVRPILISDNDIRLNVAATICDPQSPIRIPQQKVAQCSIACSGELMRIDRDLLLLSPKSKKNPPDHIRVGVLWGPSDIQLIINGVSVSRIQSGDRLFGLRLSDGIPSGRFYPFPSPGLARVSLNGAWTRTSDSFHIFGTCPSTPDPTKSCQDIPSAADSNERNNWAKCNTPCPLGGDGDPATIGKYGCLMGSFGGGGVRVQITNGLLYTTTVRRPLMIGTQRISVGSCLWGDRVLIDKRPLCQIGPVPKGQSHKIVHRRESPALFSGQPTTMRYLYFSPACLSPHGHAVKDTYYKVLWKIRDWFQNRL